MTSGGFVVLWAGLFLGALFFFGFFFRSKILRSIVQSTAFRVAFQYAQLSTAPLFVDMEWPPEILNVLRVAMSIFRLDFIEFGTPECAVTLSWALKWFLGMVLPCVVIGLLFGWRALHKKDDARRSYMTYAIAALVFYLPLQGVVEALKPFGCSASSDPSSGQRALIYTGEVSCWSTTHVVLLILGIVFAFLFSVVPVGWFAYKLEHAWMMKCVHDVDDERIKERYGFLYQGLRKDCLYSERYL